MKDLVSGNSDLSAKNSNEVTVWSHGEIVALVQSARLCPRDEELARAKIMQSAKNFKIAEKAIYKYPRGGATVEGASIRAVEVMAQKWGNVTHGTFEIARDKGKSVMMVRAWDLETNTSETRQFTVYHKRDKKGVVGGVAVTDERDVYELTANFASRRRRACLLGVLPPDLVEEFISACKKTLSGDNTVSLKNRIDKMINAFLELGVPTSKIENKFGSISGLSPENLVELTTIYNSIKDGMGSADDYLGYGEHVDNADVPNPMTDMVADVFVGNEEE